MVHLTEAPGFGLEIDWEGVEKFRGLILWLDLSRPADPVQVR